ncbi:CPBP family intramembrane glutamic endopeptidase [Anaerosphaera multitolerans]|uniref:CPBP family intramembrane metalloprotease n=1 Tax=Anaerosphaera multitolerans TaxID=2487351 RepID=A0A437S615_9FIRM|nr:CPBP family intramembrane glutamic endopeptidase [Anaerosphaera multitolerans]RVU54356.1 CPBP family intramembrane metalloprotease [Anaerosphaera multitolerans]
MDENLIRTEDYTDFPFGNVSNLRWFLSLTLLFLTFFLIFVGGIVENIIIAIVFFVAGCFVSLYLLDKRFWRKVFKPLKLGDLFKIFLVLLFTYAAAFLVSQLSVSMNDNPIIDMLSKDKVVIYFFISILQLLGEEILFLIPFLFIFNKLKYKTNKKVALTIAWFLSSEIFGILHLPTYSYNLFQCLVVIATIRFALSLGYIWTKNLTVTYIVHVLYDWIILLLLIFAI